VPNDFTIMRFSDGTQDFVCVEHVAGGLNIDDERDFELFVDAWDRLRGSALETGDTAAFLTQLSEQLRAQLPF
jgi:hypothetical protein